LGKLDSKSEAADVKKEEENSIIGIEIISQLVSKVIDNPMQIFSGLKQILFFYKLLPAEWTTKAYYIFERLWNKKKVVMSTNPDQPKQIYDVVFDDVQLNNLYYNLPQSDQAILIQGKAMLDLISKGFHSDSDGIKFEIETRHGIRGSNIVNMITTKDVYYLLEELPEKPSKQDYEKSFNDWAANYDSIALLVSPTEINSFPGRVETKIIELAKKNVRKYLLLNLSGRLNECIQLLQLVYKLKEDKKLNYKEIGRPDDISDSGFCKSIRIKIVF